MSTGHRYGGAEAESAGLVDATATEDRLLAEAVERVAPLAGKDAPTLGAIKATMYAAAARALRHEQPQT